MDGIFMPKKIKITFDKSKFVPRVIMCQCLSILCKFRKMPPQRFSKSVFFSQATNNAASKSWISKQCLL